MRMSGRRDRWTRRIVDACLRTWPEERRDRHGPSLARAIADQLADRARGSTVRWAGWLLLECISIVGAGISLRLRWLVSRVGGFLGGLAGDARMSTRSLRRNPSFTLATVCTLALGIGANAAVLGTVDRVLFAPAPYHEADRLAFVWNTIGDDPARMRVSAPDVAVFRERARLLESITFTNRVMDGAVVSPTDGSARHARIATVSHDFFDVLGVEAALGRGFAPDDGPRSADGAAEGSTPRSVVLADHFWRSVFAADPTVIGRGVTIDGAAAVVVGVMPPDFRLLLPPDAGIAADADVWVALRVPLSAFQRGQERLVDQDSDNTGVAIARLRRGASFEAARAELARIGLDLQTEIPSYEVADLRVDVRPLRADATEHARGVSAVLVLGATLLLAVASLGIATLVLARGIRRGPELAVRSALGSGRARIIRALSIESLLITALGTVAALAVASALTDLLAGLLPPELARVAGPGRETRFVAAAGLFSALVVSSFGVLPGLRGMGARGLRSTVVAGSRRGSASGRARGVLVGFQVAMSVALVTSGLLIARSVDRVRDQRPGFDAEGAVTFSASFRVADRYPGPADRARLVREIETRLLELPGVRAAGLVGGLPLAGDRWTQPYGLPAQAEHEWEANRADFRVVSSGLFEALGIRLLEGRTFTRDEDLEEDRRVVVIDAAMARRIAPTGSAVGATVGFPLDGDAVRAEVVGVVERVRYDDLARFGREALYVPYRQEASRDVSFVVRSDMEPAALIPALREAVRAVDPQIPVYDARPMTDHVAAAQAPVRFAMALVGVFAILTLIAAGTGLYGLVAYDAASRTGDLGLRMAVGATSTQVRRLVLAEGVRLGGAGAVAGLALAGGCSLLIGRQLPGVVLADPWPWVVAAAVAVVVTAAASWIPAYRASRLDPTVALRAE